MTSRIVNVAMFFAVLGMSVTLAAQRGQTGSACGRTCLTGIADACLAALAAHDPTKAPMAPNVQFTEQTQPIDWRRAAREAHRRGADNVHDPREGSDLESLVFSRFQGLTPATQ